MENENFKDLKIDKKNDEVYYNDEKHIYWTIKDNKRCVSATTLIHQFTSFDEEFWSKYKALESILNKNRFDAIKPKLLANKIFDNSILKELNISDEKFNTAVNTILSEWEEKREISCKRGTDIHATYEKSTLEKDYSGLKKFGFEGFKDYEVNTSNIINPGKYIIPEMLISRISDDGIIKVTGQADLVIVDGNKFKVLDYKTNKEIKMKSFYDRAKRSSTKMKYPLNNLDDTNFWHYTLQLSLYAWIIMKNNPEMELDGLFLLHHDHDDNKKVYKCDYLEDEIVRMLLFHRKQMLYEEYKQRNKKPCWMK